MRLNNFLPAMFLLLSMACSATPAPTSSAPTASIVPTFTEAVQNTLDPESWIQKQSMPSPRSEMPAVELDGLVYVVGGFGPVPGGLANGKDSVRTFETYDLKRDAWFPLAPAPEARDHSMMTTHQEKIYVFGGYEGDWEVHDNAWVYDPAADAWTVLNPMPLPRTSGAAVSIGDFIYLIGGITSRANTIVPNWRYDPANDTWQEIAPLLQPREHVSAVALNGLIFALAGRWTETLNSVEVYDPLKNEWTAGIPMKDKRAGFGATVMDGKIYVAGGELIEVLKTVKSAEAFDPATQTWSLLPDLPGGLHGVPLAGFDGVLYVLGGSGRAADMINWGRVYAYRP